MLFPRTIGNRNGRIALEHYLIMYRPPRSTFGDDATEAESAVIAQHFTYLSDLHAKGILLLAGRTSGAEFGIAILEVDSESTARALMEADPAVSNNVFTGELYPYSLALLAGR